MSSDEAALAELPAWLRVIGEEARATATGGGATAPITAAIGALPDDFYARLLADPMLLKRWCVPLAMYPSLSEAALAIAGRLVRAYPGDTDAQRLAVLATSTRHTLSRRR